MKRLKSIFMVLGIVMLAGLTAFGIPESMEAFTGIESAGVLLATSPMWFVIKDGKKEFKVLTEDELKELSDEEFGAYMTAKFDGLEGKMTKLVKEKADATEERLKELATEISEAKDDAHKAYKEATEVKLKNLATAMERLKEASGEGKINVSLLKEHADAIKLLKEAGNSFSIELKADATYADLTHTGQLDQIAATISDIVKKKPVMWELFNKIPMVTETYTYLEQTSVVRNAQGVAGCAKGFTSLTKEEIGVQRTNYVKLKDTTDICRDYMDDFSFVEERYNRLLKDSVAFMVDTEIINGTNTAISLNSLNVVSSEFSAVNPSAPIGATIPLANMSDLILGMATQIDVLGKLASFNANVCLVNKMDWFIQIESAKDTQGRYLDPRIRMVNGLTFINDILLIPHVDVPANKLFVFDTTMGDILDRKMITFALSDSNGTNFVDEFVTMMVTTKLQFLVENNNANAFMKCSDITAGILAIKKP